MALLTDDEFLGGDSPEKPASKRLLNDDEFLGAEPVAFGSVARGFNRLQQAGSVALREAGVISDEDAAAAIARDEADIARYPMPEKTAEGLRKISESKTWGETLRSIISNPEAIGSIMGESLAPSLAIQAAGVVTSGGGRSLPGLVAGSGAGSFGMEYSSTIIETMREQGVDVSDPEQIAAAFQNEDLMSAAREAGLKRGIPIAVFDAVSFGIAGRVNQIVTGGAKAASGLRRGAGQAGEVGAQAGLGAGGEAAAQLADKGEIRPGDVALEGVAEVVTSIPEVAIGEARLERQAKDASVEPQPETNIPVGAESADTLFGVENDERADSPRLTPADRASPIPNAVIDDGKKLVEDALAGTGAKPAARPTVESEVEAVPAINATAPERAAIGSPDQDFLTSDKPAAEPTEAQAAAGNYQKRHVRVQGLDVSIETEAGGVRRGKGPNGAWEVTLPVPYGYIRRTEGADGDQVDVYLGPTNGDQVFVIDQIDANTKAFDEHKAMIGFPSQEDALAAYEQAFSDGRAKERVGAVTAMPMLGFKQWLKSGDTAAPLSYSAPKTQPSDEIGQLEVVDVKQRAKPKRRMPLNILEFIAAKGGIQDQTGELKFLGLSKKFLPGFGRVVREKGLPPDRIRELVEEAGFIRSGNKDASTSLADLYNAMEQNGRGTPIYAEDDQSKVEQIRAERTVQNTAEQAKQDEFDQVVATLGGKMTDEEKAQFAELIADGWWPEEAAAEVMSMNALSIEAETADSRAQGESTDVPFFDDERPANRAGEKPEDQSRGGKEPDAGAEERTAPARGESGGREQADRAGGRAPEDELGRFAKNAIFTADKVAAARARLKDKLRSQLGSGIDPEIIADGMTIAGAYIEAGVRGFAEFSAKMVEDMGEGIRPFLLSFYEAVRNYPGLDTAGMTPTDEARALAQAKPEEKPSVDYVRMSGTDLRKLAASDPGAQAEIDRRSAKREAKKAPQATERQEETAPDLGTAEAPNVQAFGRLIGAYLASPENRFPTIVQARKFVAEKFGGETFVAGSPAAKLVDEAVELGVVLAAREIVAANAKRLRSWPNKKHSETFDALLSLHERQPTLGTRTSTSIENQAYSTPVPLAYVASRLANIQGRHTSVLEPTAGNGALLIEADPANVTANELDESRVASLEAQGFRATSKDASEGGLRHAGYPVDVVIANPPFGMVRDGQGQPRTFKVDDRYSTNEIDHVIALRALEAMKEDGNAVLLVGGPNKLASSEEQRSDAYNGKSKREFYITLYGLYNVVDHFTVSGDLYSKQGASWPIDVIVIRGKGKSARKVPAADVPRIIRSWEGVKGLLDVEYPDAERGSGRPSVEPSGQPAERAATAADDVAGESVRPDGDAIRPGGDVAVRSRPSGGREPQPGGRRDRVESKDAGIGGGRADVAPDLFAATGKAAPPPDRKPVDTSAKQVPYTPKSGRAGMGTLVPVNMQTALQDSLDNLERRVGDIDAFVGRELGYTPAQLDEYFGAEQIDGIALVIDNLARGAALIIGDQTGIGKGRQVAAMLRWARRNKKTPIFVTEKPTLYADMYRDLTDIGEKKPRIFMTNSGETVPLNDEGDVLRSRGSDLHKAEMRKMVTAGAMKDADFIFTTYSQMQTVQGEETERMTFLRAMVTANGVIVFDESHNAGGTEAEGMMEDDRMTRAKFARELVSMASGVVYSSATYAKRPSVMDLYSKTDMRLAVEDITKLGDLISAGGVPMQQIVAAMLAQAGQYVRRERSFEGVTYDTAAAPTDKAVYERFSASIKAIQMFSEGAVKDATKSISRDLKAEGKSISGDGSTGGAGAASTNFTAVMHNVIGQMLLAIKADTAADMAIETLRAGEKPVITVANTMEAFISEYAELAGLKSGDATNLDFKALLLRYLERSRTITIKRPFMKKGEKGERHYLTDEELGPSGVREFGEVTALIEGGDFGALPASPIDYMKAKIRRAGFKVGEITGRGMIIDYRADGQGVIAMRGADETSIRGKRKAISDFNGGALDALVLNRSGSTGLSLHASEKVKDKRKRHMILAQPEANIDTHMQMLGRVHRTGQIVTPRYSQLVADVPAEKRPAAVLAKKMASLNANTTASRGGALTAKDVPDLMNEFGDKVAASVMRDNPDIHDYIGSPLQPAKNGYVAEDAMRKVTGRIPLLPLAQQELIYEMLESEYVAMIAQLEAAGENTLEAKTLELDARPIERRQLKEAADSASPFADGVWLDKVDAKLLGKPMTSTEALKDVAKVVGYSGEITKETAEQAHRVLKRDGERSATMTQQNARAAFIAYKRETLDEMATAETRATTETRLNDVQVQWQALMNVAKPGAGVKLMTNNMGNLYGIVIETKKTGKAKNPLALGAWKARIALADASREMTIPFTQLFTARTRPSEETMQMMELAPVESIGSMPLVKAFDDMQADRREDRYIATGNLLAAYEVMSGKGTITNYTDSQGNIRQGILQKRDFDPDAFFGTKPVRFSNSDHILRFIEQVKDGAVYSTDRNSGVRMVPNGDVRFTVESSKAKGGVYYLDKGVREAAGRDFVQVSGEMRMEVPPTVALRVLDALRRAGAVYETTTELDVAREITGEKRPGMLKIEGIAEEGEATFKPVVDSPRVRALVADLRDRLDKIGMPGIGLRLWEAIKAELPDGRVVEAGGHYYRGVIDVALGGDPFSTLNHEALHAMRDLGLFTETEWSILTSMSRSKWMKRYGIAENYGDFPSWAQEEEGIAHAFEDWAAGGRTESMVSRIFAKIRQFLKALYKSLTGQDIRTAEDIFAMVAMGQVGRRPLGDNRRAEPSFAIRQEDLVRAVDGVRYTFDDPWQARLFTLGERLIEQNGLTLDEATSDDFDVLNARGLDVEIAAVRQKMAPYLIGAPASRQEFMSAAVGYAAGILDDGRTKGQNVEAGSAIEPEAGADWLRSIMQEVAEGDVPLSETVDTVDGPREQLVIPGAERVSNRTMAERQMQGRKASKKPQKSVSDLPLFDDAPKQGSLFSLAPKTESEAFRTWFGKSKVVDETGKPRAVYHGTYTAFEAFDSTKPAITEGGMNMRAVGVEAYFFTGSRKVAENFSSGVIIEAYLSLQNPLILDAEGDAWMMFEDDIIAAAKGGKHDGVIIRNVEDAMFDDAEEAVSDVFVAFRPEQIKSVDNRGSFDPSDRRMMYKLRRAPKNAAEGQEVMQGFIARGQPVDRAIRVPFDLLGGVENGVWVPGKRITERIGSAGMTGASLAGVIGAGIGSLVAPGVGTVAGGAAGATIGGYLMGARIDPHGRFGWLHGIAENARHGLIDRYGLDEAYIDLDRNRALDQRARLQQADGILKVLANAGVGSQEASVLQAILTEGGVSDAEMTKLAVPIREAIDQMGQEAVSLGLVSAESFERNRGTYLHRVYQKDETQQGLAGWVSKTLTSKRKKIVGDQLKGRGIFWDVDVARLMRDVPEFQSGARGTPENGEHFRVIDNVLAPTADMMTSDERGRVARRIFLPADQPVPLKYTGPEFRDRGVWEVRATGKKVTLWRDYTKAEREKMGEIVDARYTIAKTFMLMANDLATGRFYQQVAENENWTRSAPPATEWKVAEEYNRYWNDPEIGWVRVPDTEISNTGGKKRWGALAGKYVRSEIWRDLNELDIASNPGTWRKLLRQWKLNKTARNPVVHMNNIMSNMVLMDLADVRMQDLVAGLQAYVSGGKDYEEARDNGAFGADMMAQEIRENVLKPILEEIKASSQGGVQVGWLTKFSAAGVLADKLWTWAKTADRKMRDAYQMEDEVFRMATYMRRRSLGDSPRAAARNAHDQFLNYDIRAPWVVAARNTVLPFISYTYRAVPKLAEGIAHRPWKLAKYMAIAYAANALAYAWDDGDDGEERERASLPQQEQGYTWLVTPRMMRMPWRDEDGLPVFLDVRRWIPGGDIFDTQQGSSAIPIPAPLQFGGPLLLAFEFLLNRQSFTGKDITNDLIDDNADKAESVGDWLWKAWVPSAFWVPGSWYWDKIAGTIEAPALNMTKGTSSGGKPFSTGEAFLSAVGIKMRSIDVEDGLSFRAWEFKKVQDALRAEARRIGRQREMNRITQAAYDKEMAEMTEKFADLDARWKEFSERSQKRK